MSTTEAAIADGPEKIKRPHRERATALGPGILRLADGSYVRPESASISVRCLGPLAHWVVKATFPALPAVEGEEELLYLYPLPPESALNSLSVDDTQLLPGTLSVRALAELDEEERPVPSAALIAEFGDETLPVLTLQLETLLGEGQGESGLEVALEYSSGLPTVDGRVCLVCPTTVSDDLNPDGTTAFEVSVTIEDGTELVDEPMVPFSVTTEKDGESIAIKGAFESTAEDFVVTFRPGRTQMPVTRLRRSEEHFIFSIFPPTSIPASPQRRDIVFALDASENVEPQFFEQIKKDLSASLRSLDENDRFALVTFGRDIDGYDGGEFCDIEQVEAACEWLENAKPKGRADVQPLLQRIQMLPSQEDRQLCIFLLAGGHVGNEPAILKSLDFDQSDRRYYTVGLGPTVHQSFIRRLALLTRGRCEIASDGGCAQALERLLGQTRALLAEVTFEDTDDSEIDSSSLVPSRMTSLTPQGPVHCLGKGAPSALRFRSKDETGVFFAGTVNAQETENPALAGVWAGLRVRELLDSLKLSTGQKRSSLREEASNIAVSHGILTRDTVLATESEQGLIIQYSAQPSKWRGSEPKGKKGNVSTKDSSAPFDWRKGLVAREGLFKGSKANAGADSGESSGRYGLRAKTKGANEGSGKPRLGRTFATVSGSTSEEEPSPEVAPEEAEELSAVEEESAEDTAVVSEEEAEVTDEPAPEESIEPPAQESVEQSAAPPTAAPPQAPAMSLQTDPLAGGRNRLSSYRTQLSNFDADLALSAILGLPGELSPRGGELARILAQTVAHLEKRGYFAHAVSVLRLMLKDNPSPEVSKKMSSLLIKWVDSLDESQLPEAVQILILGQRVCQGSPELEEKTKEYWDRWNSAAQEQSEMPLVQNLVDQGEENLESLLSEPQLELARLKESQQSLTQQVQQLQQTVDQQLSNLPGLLESIAEKTAAKAAEAVSEAASKIVVQAPPVPRQDTVAPAEAEAPQTQTETAPPPEPEEEVVTEPTPVVEPEPEPETSKKPEPEPEPEPERAVEEEPEVEPEPEPEVEEVPVEEESEETLPAEELTREELTELLLADPRSESSRKAVESNLTEPKERINFFRDLVKADKSEPYHSLSLARAYRYADQTKVAVVHYQKYLRAEKDSQAYLELAEAYDELGKANLSASARKAAEAYST